MATAEQIIDVSSTNRLSLNKEKLKKILLKDEIKDLPVVVVSIVGTYRQGKSFLLNFLLRFLNLTCIEKKNVKDWLNPTDGSLSGFTWKKSSQRETVGIMMWSEIFISTLPSGDKVGIILLDTQGTFDNEGDLNDFATIFAFSTLLSSVQIYNMMHNIKQNDLMSLKDFLSYGALVNEKNPGETACQNLIFLIRDWANVEEFPYGEEGGQKYVKSQLRFNPKDAERVSELKKSVQQFFSKTSGFILPDPGQEVVKNATKNLGEIDDNFRTYVKLLVEKILKPENLVVKECNGKKIKASDLYILIENYHEVFQSGEMPQLQSIFQANAEAQHLSALEECIQIYERAMNFDQNPKSKSQDERILKSSHEMKKKSTLNEFDKMKKMGDEKMKEKYKKTLSEKLETFFASYENLNQIKLQREEQERQKRELLLRNQQNEKMIASTKQQLAYLTVQNEHDKKEREKIEKKLIQVEKEKEYNNRRIHEIEIKNRQSEKMVNSMKEQLEYERVQNEHDKNVMESMMEQQRMQQEQDREEYDRSIRAIESSNIEERKKIYNHMEQQLNNARAENEQDKKERENMMQQLLMKHEENKQNYERMIREMEERKVKEDESMNAYMEQQLANAKFQMEEDKRERERVERQLQRKQEQERENYIIMMTMMMMQDAQRTQDAQGMGERPRRRKR